MFKKVLSGLTKFFTKERIIILAIFLILAWALYNYAGSKSMILDRMSDGSGSSDVTAPSDNSASTAITSSVKQEASSTPNGYSQKSVADPSDLLPLPDANSEWGALNPNPMNQGEILSTQLIAPGARLGEVSQTLRNPNLQLRSDPPIQKADIGPWNQSTIEPDLGRVPLEIGGGYR